MPFGNRRMWRNRDFARCGRHNYCIGGNLYDAEISYKRFNVYGKLYVKWLPVEFQNLYARIEYERYGNYVSG